MQEGNIGDRVQTILLDLVKQERDGKTIDRMLFKSTVSVLVDTHSYEEFLENNLCKVTRKYYMLWGYDQTKSSDVPQYLEKCFDKLRQEFERVDYYLHPVCYLF